MGSTHPATPGAHTAFTSASMAARPQLVGSVPVNLLPAIWLHGREGGGTHGTAAIAVPPPLREKPAPEARRGWPATHSTLSTVRETELFSCVWQIGQRASQAVGLQVYHGNVGQAEQPVGVAQEAWRQRPSQPVVAQDPAARHGQVVAGGAGKS